MPNASKGPAPNADGVAGPRDTGRRRACLARLGGGRIGRGDRAQRLAGGSNRDRGASGATGGRRGAGGSKGSGAVEGDSVRGCGDELVGLRRALSPSSASDREMFDKQVGGGVRGCRGPQETR